jgi:hypothetical protein
LPKTRLFPSMKLFGAIFNSPRYTIRSSIRKRIDFCGSNWIRRLLKLYRLVS